MSTALSERPQVANRRLSEHASRYDSKGCLWVKHNGDWMTHSRCIATIHAERFGVTIPAGHRVILVNAGAPVVPSNLLVKPRGKTALPLREFIRQQSA